MLIGPERLLALGIGADGFDVTLRERFHRKRAISVALLLGIGALREIASVQMDQRIAATKNIAGAARSGMLAWLGLMRARTTLRATYR